MLSAQPLHAADPSAAALAALAAAASVEATPKAAAREDLAALLRPGSEVFLTHLPGAVIGERAAACRAVAAAGLRPVPHVSAHEAASIAALEREVAALMEAGASGIMLVGGGGPQKGPFADAAALLESGVLARHGVRRLALAGHPEGHPQASEAALAASLARKIALARAFADEVRIITQFVFEAAPLLAWLERLREGGIDVPVRAGLSGPATPRTLLSYALRCGVGPSMKALQGRPQLAARLHRRWRPDALAGEIAAAIAARPELGVESLHLFPFGGLAAAAEWLSEQSGAAALSPHQEAAAGA